MKSAKLTMSDIKVDDILRYKINTTKANGQYAKYFVGVVTKVLNRKHVIMVRVFGLYSPKKSGYANVEHRIDENLFDHMVRNNTIHRVTKLCGDVLKDVSTMVDLIRICCCNDINYIDALMRTSERESRAASQKPKPVEPKKETPACIGRKATRGCTKCMTGNQIDWHCEHASCSSLVSGAIRYTPVKMDLRHDFRCDAPWNKKLIKVGR